MVDLKSIRSDDHQYMKKMMTHVRRIARCMLCVDREQAAKDVAVKMKNIGLKIKQAQITNLEIRLQADCAIDSCANYSWQNFSSVMST